MRHINAKRILYLNLKLDEVLKVQTTHWLLNYRSGHCLETRQANLCQLPRLTYADVVCTYCTGWLFMNLTVFWKINNVMQTENMLNKYGWQSPKHECEQECGLLSEYKCCCLRTLKKIIFKDHTQTQEDIKVRVVRERKADRPLFSANYIMFYMKKRIIKLIYSKLNLRGSFFFFFRL